VVAFLSYISAYNMVVSISHCKEWAQFIHCNMILKYLVASQLGFVSILLAATKPRRLVEKNGCAIIPQNTERVLCHSFLVTTTVEENGIKRWVALFACM
jgi:hypothetical protein